MAGEVNMVGKVCVHVSTYMDTCVRVDMCAHAWVAQGSRETTRASYVHYEVDRSQT